jgi:hypothetical protein
MSESRAVTVKEKDVMKILGMTESKTDPVPEAGGDVVPYYEKPFDQWPIDARFRLCEVLAKSDCIPAADRGKMANIYFKAERGARLGLSPTESISSILVVNGATSVWGDMGLALVRKSGLLAGHDEWYEIDGVRWADDDFDIIELHKHGARIVAKCSMTRRGDPPKVSAYSVQDAIDAGLWGEKDPWRKSPKRMLMWRPRSFVMRDKFQDVLYGFVTVEEARDITPEAERGAIAEASQPDTKGKDLAEKIEGADAGVMTEDTKQEVEMLESILTAGGREKIAATIAADLRLPASGITQAQASLYVRALGLAIDQMNADADAKTGKTQEGGGRLL